MASLLVQSLVSPVIHATDGNHSTGCSGPGVPANSRFCPLGPLRREGIEHIMSACFGARVQSDCTDLHISTRTQEEKHYGTTEN